MWQFAEACRGLKDGCLELGIPVTGGNVSLYNQTGETAILPTPVVAVLGVDRRRHPPDAVGLRRPPARRSLLLGETREELSGSEWAHVVHGHLGGLPPRVDLAAEKALAELLHDARRGCSPAPTTSPTAGWRRRWSRRRCAHGRRHASTCPSDPFVALFSESTGPVLVTVPADDATRLAALAARARRTPHRAGRDRWRRAQSGESPFDLALLEVRSRRLATRAATLAGRPGVRAVADDLVVTRLVTPGARAGRAVLPVLGPGRAGRQHRRQPGRAVLRPRGSPSLPAYLRSGCSSGSPPGWATACSRSRPASTAPSSPTAGPRASGWRRCCARPPRHRRRSAARPDRTPGLQGAPAERQEAPRRQEARAPGTVRLIAGPADRQRRPVAEVAPRSGPDARQDARCTDGRCWRLPVLGAAGLALTACGEDAPVRESTPSRRRPDPLRRRPEPVRRALPARRDAPRGRRGHPRRLLARPVRLHPRVARSRRPGRRGLGRVEPRVPPGRQRRRRPDDLRRRRRRHRQARRPRRRPHLDRRHPRPLRRWPPRRPGRPRAGASTAWAGGGRGHPRDLPGRGPRPGRRRRARAWAAARSRRFLGHAPGPDDAPLDPLQQVPLERTRLVRARHRRRNVPITQSEAVRRRRDRRRRQGRAGRGRAATTSCSSTPLAGPGRASSRSSTRIG